MVARIRSVKPEFFQHEAIFEAEQASGLPLRLAYIGLWTQTDRRGLFRWRPRELKLNVLPYDNVDFGAILDALANHGFLVRYEVDGSSYGYIPSFASHQLFNIKEKAAQGIPGPDDTVLARCRHGVGTSLVTVGSDGIGIGKGKGTGSEGKGRGVGKGGEAERGAAPASGGGPPAPEGKVRESLESFEQRQSRVIATLMSPRRSEA